MNTRRKFKIPTENEITETSEFKPKSLFESYKQARSVPAQQKTLQQDHSNVQLGQHINKTHQANDTKKEEHKTQLTNLGLNLKPNHLAGQLLQQGNAIQTLATNRNMQQSTVSSKQNTKSVQTSSNETSAMPTTAMTTSLTKVTMTTTVVTAVQCANTTSNIQTMPSASTSKTAYSNSIIVNFRQRGNPILKHIRNIPWEYGSIVPDYVMGKATCALFLSLRYHQLHPEYLHNRLKELGKGYDLRVLLLQVDVKEAHFHLRELAKICLRADLTLLLAFSPEEAGRYLEAYKVYENKPAEVLMEKTDTDFVSKLTECLTTVKSINKTDSLTLLSAFKSMEGIINASKEDLTLCAGFGPQKAQRLYDVFHEPFLKAKKCKIDNISESSKGVSPAKKSC